MSKIIKNVQEWVNGRIISIIVVLCDCKRKIHLNHNGDTTCDCGAEYNCVGQRLKDK